MEKALILTKSLETLKKYKIPVPRFSIAKNVRQAMKIAKKIGYPVALKLVSKDIIHKTDIGGIKLDVKSDEELLSSFEQILLDVKKKNKKVTTEGILVQEMIPKGQELIIGGKHDQQFGKIIVFGLGGVFAEVFDDVSMRVIPISERDAMKMIEEIKGYRILSGYRGSKYDIKSLTDILLKTSKLLSDNKSIKELDINPVIVSSKGAVAVDARIIVE